MQIENPFHKKEDFNYINLDYIDKICGEDNQCIKELIDIFLEQIPAFISNINKYMDEKNLGGLAKEAHKAKSSVMIFMMDETEEILKKIHKLANSGNSEDLPFLVKQLEKKLSGATEELSEYLLLNF